MNIIKQLPRLLAHQAEILYLGQFEGHHNQSDEECGCTCLTAAEKQRWLDTMDEYDRKLKRKFYRTTDENHKLLFQNGRQNSKTKTTN